MKTPTQWLADLLRSWGDWLDSWIRQPAHLAIILCGRWNRFTAKPVRFTRIEVNNMALTLTDEEMVMLRLNPKTRAGNPAKLDGPAVWTASDPSIVTLAPADDGLTCNALSTGTLGSCRVTAAGDADLGPGVRTLTAVFDIEVHAAEAVSLDIVADTPTPKPPA